MTVYSESSESLSPSSLSLSLDEDSESRDDYFLDLEELDLEVEGFEVDVLVVTTFSSSESDWLSLSELSKSLLSTEYVDYPLDLELTVVLF